MRERNEGRRICALTERDAVALRDKLSEVEHERTLNAERLAAASVDRIDIIERGVAEQIAAFVEFRLSNWRGRDLSSDIRSGVWRKGGK